MRLLLDPGPTRGTLLVVHSAFAPIPTDPPAGAGGIAAFWPRNLLRSSSCDSSKRGSSPGLAGIGGVKK